MNSFWRIGQFKSNYFTADIKSSVKSSFWQYFIIFTLHVERAKVQDEIFGQNIPGPPWISAKDLKIYQTFAFPKLRNMLCLGENQWPLLS